MTTHATFQNQFFARSLHQSFNMEVMPFQSDDYMPAVIKWVRAHPQG